MRLTTSGSRMMTPTSRLTAGLVSEIGAAEQGDPFVGGNQLGVQGRPRCSNHGAPVFGPSPECGVLPDRQHPGCIQSNVIEHVMRGNSPGYARRRVKRAIDAGLVCGPAGRQPALPLPARRERMTTKAAVWLRVSTGHQDSDNQVPDVEQFASHHGYDIAERYVVSDSAWNGGKDGGEYKKALKRAGRRPQGQVQRAGGVGAGQDHARGRGGRCASSGSSVTVAAPWSALRSPG